MLNSRDVCYRRARLAVQLLIHARDSVDEGVAALKYAGRRGVLNVLVGV